MIQQRGRRAGRLLGLVAAFAMALTGCGGYGGSGDAGGKEPDGGTELAVVRVGVLPIADFAPILVAQQQGYFTNNGIRVEITNFSGGAAAIPALEGGSLDVIGGNLVSTIQAHVAGLDVKCFSGIVRKASDGHMGSLLTGPGSSVATPADLAGKTIAVNTLMNINQLIVMAWLKEQGVDPSSAEFMAVNFPDMPQALSNGQVDVALVEEPFLTMALDNGAKVLEPRPYQALANAPAFSCLASMGRWLEANKDVAAAFVRAVQQGIEYLQADRSHWEALLTNDYKVPADIAERMNLPVPTTELTNDDIQVWIDAAAEYGLIEQSFDAADMIALAGA